MPRRAGDMKMTEFGTRLEQVRVQERPDSSQASFARELNIIPQRYSAWLKGDGHPDVAMYKEIRRLTGVDLNWLIVGEAPTSVRVKPAGGVASSNVKPFAAAQKRARNNVS